jgi:AcrR family transcriptional regulator
MDTFDPETFEIKFQIADAATDLYVENGGSFLIRDAADRVDITPAEVFDYFPNKRSILEFYYASLIVRYEMMISEIEGFEAYTLSEKFSNFAFTSFDMLSEKKAFVKQSFNKLILNNFSKTNFEKELQRLARQFLEEDDQLSIGSAAILNYYLYVFIVRQYLELVKFWLNDDSEDQELTMEYTDKLTSFFEELMYNTVLDKGLDLAKFMNANRKAFFSNIPIVKKICSKIEIR